MIEVRNVFKSYGEVQVLRDISFSVKRAESKIVLGNNSSGKSTLLRLLMGLEKPDSGEIIIDGKDITKLNEWELIKFRKNKSIVFQEGALFDSLTIRDNVGFKLYDEGWDEEEVDEIVFKLLQFVGLEHTIDMYPSELSGGMKRRVAIARAMAGEPNVIFYDDPTAGLDPVTSRTICDLIVKLRDIEGVTSVVVTHDLSVAYFISNFMALVNDEGMISLREQSDDFCFINSSFLMLKDGRVIFDGSEKALRKCEDPFVREFIS